MYTQDRPFIYYTGLGPLTATVSANLASENTDCITFFYLKNLFTFQVCFYTSLLLSVYM